MTNLNRFIPEPTFTFHGSTEPDVVTGEATWEYEGHDGKPMQVSVITTITKAHQIDAMMRQLFREGRRIGALNVAYKICAIADSIMDDPES